MILKKQNVTVGRTHARTHTWTHAGTDNVKTVYPPQTKFVGGINILNFTITVFIKILGVQEAGSVGVIWLNTVVFLCILVNKHSVNISSNGNTQLIFLYAVYILRNIMKLMCPNSNGNLDVPDQCLSLKSLEKYRRHQHQIFTVVCCNIRVYAEVLASNQYCLLCKQ